MLEVRTVEIICTSWKLSYVSLEATLLKSVSIFSLYILPDYPFVASITFPYFGLSLEIMFCLFLNYLSYLKGLYKKLSLAFTNNIPLRDRTSS